MNLLLQSCNLIDHTGLVTAGQDLLIREGRIAARGAGLAPPDPDTAVLDCSTLFLSPSFLLPLVSSSSSFSSFLLLSTVKPGSPGQRDL